MFSNLIFRNCRRSRKENGLFFSSLVISIIAFYMILSISTQDVMIFLQKMESDAVNSLLLLIPVFYGVTLGILFFLIYFACKYQFERRRHEFGVYLMLGMRRSKLFCMLLAEDLLSSILALLIGLPTAVVLSEIVSLVTAKLVGMGIIGHHFSLSWSAIKWTLAGFLGIKLLALLILSGKISRQEIGTLLSQPTNRSQKQMPSVIYGLAAVLYANIKGNPIGIPVEQHQNITQVTTCQKFDKKIFVNGIEYYNHYLVLHSAFDTKLIIGNCLTMTTPVVADANLPRILLGISYTCMQ